VVVEKDSEEYQLIQAFRSLETNKKAQLMGYVDALKNKI
jgi:hypothetical protein